MSPSRARVCVRFGFRGEVFAPCIEVDVDRWMAARDGDAQAMIEALYEALGREIGIDRWSYAWDVMVMEPLEFREAQGLLADWVRDGALDAEGFARAWRKARLEGLLAGIAREHLGPDALEAEPRLLDALRAAWQAGREGGRG